VIAPAAARTVPKRSMDAALGGGLVLLGLSALLLRRYLLGTPQQGPFLVEIYLTVGAIGLAVPLAVDRPRLPWSLVLAVGISAFAFATVLTRSPMALPHGPQVLLMSSLAAVSEELLFRRLLYGVLARRSVALAVAGSAVTFAAVHIPIYGFPAFWVDLGAGLVLSWQRWASGSWVPSGATHVVANLLVVAR
jgi:membrane protease YdiL (CAAX protease family)